MREIIYRAWEYKLKEWHYFHIPQNIGNNVIGMSNKLNYQYWCEYTGIKDKNNKGIYEKDIIKDIDTIRLVKWDTDTSSYKLFRNDNTPRNISYDIYNSIDYEIIGNIYENPEMLI